MVQVGETYLTRADLSRRRHRKLKKFAVASTLAVVAVVGVVSVVVDALTVSDRVASLPRSRSNSIIAAGTNLSTDEQRAQLSVAAVHALKTEPTSLNPTGEQNSEPLSQDLSEQSHYVIKKGDSLAQILREVGLTPVEAHSAAVSAIQLSGSTPLKIGLKLAVAKDAQGNFSRLDWPQTSGKHVVVERSANGDVAVVTREVPVVVTTRTVSGVISSSFFAAATSQGVPVEIIDELVDAMGSRIEFSRELQSGDTFTLKYQERRTVEGRELAVGELLAGGIFTGGSLKVIVSHTGVDGKLRFFDEKGDPLGNFFLRYPVQFSRITSSFTNARYHPILKKTRRHPAVDFAAASGTPVRAIGDGTVVLAGYRGDAGNMVRIKHSAKYETAYRHLKGFSKGLRAGTKVTRGQVIGFVGSTGLSTGPHLCFSLFDKGNYINPLTAKLPAVIEDKNRIPQTLLAAAVRELQAERESVVMAKGKAPHGVS